MSMSSIGCCCGIIVGFIVATFIAIAIGLGVYFYVNPEAKKSSVKKIEKIWDEVKDSSEDLFDEITSTNVKPNLEKASSNISQNTNSVLNEANVIYEEKFVANTHKSLSNTQLPKIPKSTSGEVWR